MTIAAPAFQHAQAIHLRQAEIKDHRIVGFCITQKVTFFAIKGFVDHISSFFQCAANLAI